MKVEIIDVKDLKVGDRIVMTLGSQVQPNWTAEVIGFEFKHNEKPDFVKVEISNWSEGWTRDGMGLQDSIDTQILRESVLVEWDNSQSRPNTLKN